VEEFHRRFRFIRMETKAGLKAFVAYCLHVWDVIERLEFLIGRPQYEFAR
jgi:hypothetical protein